MVYDNAQLANIFKDLSIEAARQVINERARQLREYGSIQTETKLDGTKVTALDAISDTFLRQSLAEMFLGIPLWSEEADNRGISLDEVFILDPLDGTSDIARGGKNWAITISYVVSREARVSTIYAPDRGSLYVAKGDSFEHLLVGSSGDKEPLPKTNDKVLCFLGGKNGKELYQQLGAIVSQGSEWGNLQVLGGSPAYNFALVRDGTYDHFVMGCRRDPQPEDFYAAFHVVRTAGAVTDMQGNEIDPMQYSSLLIASRQRSDHQKFLEVLAHHQFGG